MINNIAIGIVKKQVTPEPVMPEKFTSDLEYNLGTGKSLGKLVGSGTYPAEGKTHDQFLREIAVEYIAPVFNSFSVAAQPTTVEVGTVLSGAKTFNWGITLNNGVIPTIDIFDNTANALLVNTPNDGSQSQEITTKALNSSGATQSWKGIGKNTAGADINSANFVVSALYPIFYGKSAVKPTANQALINAATKSVVASTGTVNITFAASGEFIFFAIPAISASKTKWFVTELNQGSIGSISDLFGAETILEIDSPTVMWEGVEYKIYISNYATTTAGAMQLRN